MTFVTRLTLQSGDRALLEDVVADIKRQARRKGVQFKGPHADQPDELRVPRHKTAVGSDSFAAWSYTVYGREFEIVGYEEFAREVAGREFPPGVHVSAEVERRRAMS